jgi:hypothetical protein
MTFFGRRKRVAFPAFGGDVRPPILGPVGIKAQLARLATIRTLLSSIILVVALANIALALRTPGVMGTELFVADGSALGCHVASIPVE